MTELLKRRWLVGWVVEPSLMPRLMRAEAESWRDQPFRGHGAAAWTFRGACRKARHWNQRRSGPGTWEVFGPAGKDVDE